MKNIKSYAHTLVKFGILLFLLVSCKKEEQVQIPLVSTSSVSDVTATTATFSGIISNELSVKITAKGFCWSTNQNPTISDSKAIDKIEDYYLKCSITGLNSHTTYYVRAYASNVAGTGYGQQLSFTTSAVLPIISTNALTEITSTTIKSGGNIINDGGSLITARGVCWSTSNDSNTSDYTTTDGTGTGNFTSLITELIPGETYYIRAYATNSIGTSYGNILSVTTPPTLPELSTDDLTIVSEDYVKCGGDIYDDGGSEITTCGVVWSTNSKPTILDNKTEDISLYNEFGDYTFKSNLKNVQFIPNTTYYLRAYATNDAGTEYGEEKSFTIYLNFPGSTINDVDGNVYHTVRIGDQWWMVENLKTTKYNNGLNIQYMSSDSQWDDVIEEPGYCWYLNDENNKDVYGALYNYWVNRSTYSVCPSGWHVPNDQEWTNLTDFLGGKSVAGGKLKEIGTSHWNSPNSEATNESGFTALPASRRRGTGYVTIGINGYYWSSTQDEGFPNYTNWYRVFFSSDKSVSRTSGSISYGLSIRCIKN